MAAGPNGLVPILDWQELAGSERPIAVDANVPLPLDYQLTVSLVIRQRPGSQPLRDLAYWQNTPLAERRFLSPSEYRQKFGAAEDDVKAVVDFVNAYGMTVLTQDAGRRSVSVHGTAGQMNHFFRIVLIWYELKFPRTPRGTHAKATSKQPGTTTQEQVVPSWRHGYHGPVSVPLQIALYVTAVIGLDDRAISISGPDGTNDPSRSGYLSVPRLAHIYNFPRSRTANQTIGVIAPQKRPGEGASYFAPDLTDHYFPSLEVGYQTAPALIHDVNLQVGRDQFGNDKIFLNNPTNVQHASPANWNLFPYYWITELTQDIATSATIAQGATVNVYFTEDSEQGWLVFLNRVLLPEDEKQPTVVTCSWLLYYSDDPNECGLADKPASLAFVMSTLFKQLAMCGINVFVGVGDWGADDGVTDGNAHVSYPGGDPWVTSCGGTIVGNVRNGPPLSFDEFVWSDAHTSTGSDFGDADSDFGATGGGVSKISKPLNTKLRPGLRLSDSANNLHKGRGVPDVAGMVAYSGFFVNGIEYTFIGTSCVAPLYAGLTAVLQNAVGMPLGPLNPTLYQLGSDTTMSPFNDVTYGDNDSADTPKSPYYQARKGWDACTGWGSIDGTKLLRAIAMQLIRPPDR